MLDEINKRGNNKNIYNMVVNINLNIRKTVILFLLTVLTSCYQDDNLPESCIEINKQETGIQETTIQTRDIISFKITNNCNRIIRVLEAEIQTKNSKDFHFEKTPTEIPEDGLILNIIFSPQSVGKKTASIILKNDINDMIINFSANGI